MRRRTAVNTTLTDARSELPMMYIDAQDPLIAATAPTDRSMPRVAMTSVMPNATRMIGAAWRRMSMIGPNRLPSCTVMEKKV